jgi:hypothetical protein
MLVVAPTSYSMLKRSPGPEVKIEPWAIMIGTFKKWARASRARRHTGSSKLAPRSPLTVNCHWHCGA